MTFRFFKPESKSNSDNCISSRLMRFSSNKKINIVKGNVSNLSQSYWLDNSDLLIELTKRKERTCLLIQKYKDFLKKRDSNTNLHKIVFNPIKPLTYRKSNLLFTQSLNDNNHNISSSAQSSDKLRCNLQSNRQQSRRKPQWLNYSSKKEGHTKELKRSVKSICISYFKKNLNDPLAYDEFDDTILKDKNYLNDRLKNENDYCLRKDNAFDCNKYSIFKRNCDPPLSFNYKFSIYRVGVIIRRDRLNHTHSLINKH